MLYLVSQFIVSNYFKYYFKYFRDDKVKMVVN